MRGAEGAPRPLNALEQAELLHFAWNERHWGPTEHHRGTTVADGHAVIEAVWVRPGGIVIPDLIRVSRWRAVEGARMHQLVSLGLERLAAAPANAHPEPALPAEGFAHGLAHADPVGAVGSADVALPELLADAMAPRA